MTTVENYTDETIGPGPEGGGTMLVNIGPQHPSTHGVLRLVTELDGETIVNLEPVIGYLHTGFEKTYEAKTYLGGVTLTDRMDYLNPLINNLAYSLAVEKLLGITDRIPERATNLRVLLAELQRIASHLVWLGTQALDLGAMSVFLYCFREREQILDFFDEATGQRLMTSFIRPGGLMRDLPEGWLDKVRRFSEILPDRVDEYEELLTKNEIWRDRTQGIGTLTQAQALALGLTGANLRATGIPWDVRKSEPYCGYETYDFDVPTRTEGDVYARYVVRMAELRQANLIVRQALERITPFGEYVIHDHKVALPPRHELATSMESLIHHFKLASEGIRVPAGEVYQVVESARGELGFYIVADGSGNPYRVHVRAPSFVAIQALPAIATGAMVADMVAMIGSLDPVMGEVDR